MLIKCGVIHFARRAPLRLAAGIKISRNFGQAGGGVYSDEGYSLLNSTISMNTASGNGGGLGNNGGTVSLESTTIFANSAGGTGGGIQNDSVFGPVQLKNTIVARNTGTSDVDISGVQFANQCRRVDFISRDWTATA